MPVQQRQVLYQRLIRRKKVGIDLAYRSHGDCFCTVTRSTLRFSRQEI
jgi:hypothetical protein